MVFIQQYLMSMWISNYFVEIRVMNYIKINTFLKIFYNHVKRTFDDLVE